MKKIRYLQVPVDDDTDRAFRDVCMVYGLDWRTMLGLIIAHGVEFYAGEMKAQGKETPRTAVFLAKVERQERERAREEALRLIDIMNESPGSEDRIDRLAMICDNYGFDIAALTDELNQTNELREVLNQRNVDVTDNIRVLLSMIRDVMNENDGHVPSSIIKEKWLESGRSSRSLEDAKSSMGIPSRKKKGMGGAWFWVIPDSIKA